MNQMNRWKKIVSRLHRDDRGTAAVTFILCLPLFMTVFTLIVQFALILNAKMMVTDAAIAAGRSAVTSLPEEKNENIRKAALFMLAACSPSANAAANQDGQDIASALQTLGVTPPNDFARRYAFADGATQVDYALGDYKHNVGQEVSITITYKFHLDIPIARAILGGATESVGGVTGRYYTLKSTVKVQTAHGRATDSDSGTGAPLAPPN